MDRETVSSAVHEMRLDLQDGAERIRAKSAQLRIYRHRLCVCNPYLQWVLGIRSLRLQTPPEWLIKLPIEGTTRLKASL